MSQLEDDNVTVKRWLNSAHLKDPAGRLEDLQRFTVLVDRTPDQMIDECLRLVQGGQFKLKGKTRRQFVERIDEYEEIHGRFHGNAIRSFFIHNGVPIQPPILT
jgi:hypothetical protein